MKLLFITHGSSSYRTFKFFSELVDDFSVLVYKKNHKWVKQALENANLDNVKVYTSSSLLSFFIKPLFIKFDVVISHCPLSGFAMSIAKLKRKNSLMIMCNDFVGCYDVEEKDSLKKVLLKNLLKFFLVTSSRKADLIVVLSTFIKRIALGYGARNVAIIPIYGVNTNLFKEKEHGKKEADILLASRFLRHKGIDVFLEALKIVSKTKPNIKVLMVGDKVGVTKSLEKGSLEVQDYAKRLGVINNIKFLGLIPEKDMPEIYTKAKLLVIPSRSEGLGFVSAEALACGIPVVASDVGGIADIIKDEKTGLLFQTENSIEMAKKIVRLLDNASLRKKLATNGKRLVKEEFESEKVMKMFKDKFYELTNSVPHNDLER